jgi:hypothetical protein
MNQDTNNTSSSNGYESDSDISYKSSESSSSGSDTDSSVSIDARPTNSSNPHHLLSPPPSTPISGSGDTPLRHRARSSSFNTNGNPSLSINVNSPVLLRPLSASRQGSNARSRTNSIVSISLDATNAGNGNGNGNGTPVNSGSYHDIANRPRSNPRNRTPMRNSTPVLGPVNRATIANDELILNNNDLDRPASNPRSGSNSRRDNHTTSPSTRNPQSQPPTRIVGLGANLAVGTYLRSTTLSALHEHKREREREREPGYKNPNLQLSNKQGPGHRKVRRWNNDKFIGIASDISQANPQRGMQIANIYAEAEMDKGRFADPIAPRDNRTIFSTLVSAGNGSGSASGNGSGHEDEDDDNDNIACTNLDRKRLEEIRDRFVDGEVGRNNGITKGAQERMKKRQEELFQDGNRMMRVNVNVRLMNVVVRACKSSGFTRNVVDAFERLLVTNMSGSGGGGCDQMTSHTHDSDEIETDVDIWTQIMVQKPFITRKTSMGLDNTGSGVIARMLFHEDESKGAFNRLLLHAVCQFHGLETCSTTTSKGYRMLTVTGICKGSHLKFLEFVPFDVSSDYTGTRTRELQENVVVVVVSDETAETQLMLDNMAALRVQ